MYFFKIIPDEMTYSQFFSEIVRFKDTVQLRINFLTEIFSHLNIKDWLLPIVDVEKEFKSGSLVNETEKPLVALKVREYPYEKFQTSIENGFSLLLTSFTSIDFNLDEVIS